MTVYDSACAASYTHLQSAVRNGQTSVTVNAFVLAVMITGKIFLTGYDKQIIHLKYYFCHFDFFALNININTHEYFPKVT